MRVMWACSVVVMVVVVAVCVFVCVCVSARALCRESWRACCAWINAEMYASMHVLVCLWYLCTRLAHKEGDRLPIPTFFFVIFVNGPAPLLPCTRP